MSHALMNVWAKISDRGFMLGFVIGLTATLALAWSVSHLLGPF